MSFGFSVSDFINIYTLANKIRKDFVSAPSHFRNISDVLRNLSIVTQDAEVTISEQELSPSEEANLKDVLSGCKRVLGSLECTVDKYSELGSRQTSTHGKLKRVWKRLTCEPEDIRELRSSVNINITLLTALTVRLTRDNTIKLVQYQENKEKEAILGWLARVDCIPQQNDFFKKSQSGTGQWLLDSEKFKRWVETSGQTLLCPGIPGAGKTILTSIIVEELSTRFQDESGTAVAYIYCNYKRQNEQTSENLLASILKQIARRRSLLPESLKSLYDQCKAKGTAPSLGDITSVLQSVAAGYSRVFIIVDAIDECNAQDGCRAQMLSKLFDLQKKHTINLFITTRFIPEIVKEFRQDQMLEIRAHEDDVGKFIDEHISRLPSFVRSNLDLRQEIKSEIVKAVDGMFLLAQLHLDSLIGKKSPKAIKVALKRLPAGSEAYDHAYDNAMKRIEGQVSDQKELAKQVLSWVTCAKRPLNTEELQHALAVEAGETELDEDNIPALEDMVSVCAGLVTVDEESHIIRLVHYTTQEYLERTQKQWFPTAEDEILKVCLNYMSFSTFDSGVCHTDSSFEERLLLNPLYSYATHYWGVHARQVSTYDETIVSFLESEAKVQAAIQALFGEKRIIGDRGSNYSQETPKRMTGLHLAGYFGITVSAKLIFRTVDRDRENTEWSQLQLHQAVASGHKTVVKQLLDAGADIELNDTKWGQTPLWWAAASGQEAVLKMLIDAGADVESKASKYTKWGQTPLWWAAASGHTAVVKLLLDAGADTESKDIELSRTPLWMAAMGGHEALVRQLLKGGVDIEAKDKWGRTALWWAVEKGHEAVVKLLVEAGADVDTKDKWDQTPLSWAAANGLDTAVKLLQPKDRAISLPS